MLKNHIKTAVVAPAILLLSTIGAPAGDGKALLKEYVYDVQSAWTTLYVTSSEGAKWDSIEDGTLQFFAHMKIDTKWPGAVNSVGVVLGRCSVESCHLLPILWSKGVGERDFQDQGNISVPTSLLTGTTHELSSARQEIIDTCNQNLSADGATKRHEFTHVLSTTFVADTVKQWGRLVVEAGHDTLGHPFDIKHERQGDFFFNVVCKPYVKPAPVNDQQKQEDELQTTGIDLFLSTFSGATTQPNPATVCKKARVLVRVKTSTSGAAKFKLWTNVGGTMSSKGVVAWASDDGNGGYMAEHTEWISVDKPTLVQAMAEDMVNTVGQSTQWKNISLQCTGQGGGGLTVGQDEPLLPDRKLNGDFSFVDVGSPNCIRTGKALISFTSNRSEDVHYKLDCTNGRSFSGVAKMVKNQKGGYLGAGMQTFPIEHTAVYSCALKTVQPGPVKLHKWKGHTFNCVRRAVETGSTDVQVAPKPSNTAPRSRATDVKVAPKPSDADAGKRRREALKKAREAARKKAEAEKRNRAAKKAAEARRKREAAKKAAERKRKAAGRAAALKRKRKRAATKKAAALKRERAAANRRRTVR